VDVAAYLGMVFSYMVFPYLRANAKVVWARRFVDLVIEFIAVIIL
jgi:hypothetical protein